jgi:general secretion pathway protein K
VKNERGGALILTLIITALLVALIVEFTSEVFVDTSARHAFVAGQQAGLLAESGITGGVKLLNTVLEQQSYSSVADKWGEPLVVRDERGELKLVIEEESGKLNLNFVALPSGELEGSFIAQAARRLFVKEGLAADLLDSLADWLDSDDIPHPGGAETAYYNRLIPPYSARNNRLETVEELALVKGFAGSALARIKPYVTVYADSAQAPFAPVNINTAPAQVLAALDERITDEMSKRVVEYRRGSPFRNPAELARVPGFELIATSLLTRITTKGSVYRLRAEGRVNDISRVVEAVVRVGGGRTETLYWREY